MTGELFLSKSVSTRQLLHFTRQLSILISAGTPLIKSLYTISDQMPRGYFKDVINGMIKDIENGSALSLSMSKYPHIFSAIFVNMVKAGEAGGLLPSVLKRVDHFLNHSHRLREKVKLATTYPAFVLIIAIIILTALTAFIVPSFTKIFKDLGGELPIATQILIAVSEIARRFWWALLFFLAIIVMLFKFGARQPEIKMFLDRAKLRIPILGQLILNIEISRFARLLGTLIMSGVNILSSLKITQETTNNSLISEAIGSIGEKIEKGSNVFVSMKEHSVFPKVLTTMVSVGEESGQLDKILLQIADEYEEEAEDTLTALTGLLEPLLIVIMGIIVGFVVIALFFPIFTLGGMVK